MSYSALVLQRSILCTQIFSFHAYIIAKWLDIFLASGIDVGQRNNVGALKNVRKGILIHSYINYRTLFLQNV